MIHIITPSIRPRNLQVISSSIPKECNWIIILDELCKEKCKVDNATVITPEKRDKDHYNEHFNNSNWNRNYVLDNYEFKDGDWIYFLDDDNSIHPDWYKNVEKCTSTNYTMAVWGQLKSDGKTKRLPASRNNLLERNFPIACRKIDTACFMVNYKHVKDIRWITQDCVDGHSYIDRESLRIARSQKEIIKEGYIPAAADSIYAEVCSKIGENYYIPEYISYYNRWPRQLESKKYYPGKRYGPKKRQGMDAG